jgi:hypothetical protein
MISHLRHLLSPALRAANLDVADETWRIGEVWPAALGERIGSRALPLRLTRGELLVAVPDAVWRQELSLLAPEIVARLNEKLGAPVVQRLRLVGATTAAPPPRVERRRLRADDAERASGPAPIAASGEVGAALRDLWKSRARRLARDRDDVDRQD